MANVVIQTAFLGDILLSIPLLKSLRKIYPQEKLILVCRKGLEVSLQELNVADEVWAWDKSSPKNQLQLKKRLSVLQIENLVVPHRSMRTALFARSIPAKLKIGFKFWWNGLFFDERVKYDHRLPDAIRQLSLLIVIDKNTKAMLKKIKLNIEKVNPLVRVDHVFESAVHEFGLSMDLGSENLKPVDDLLSDLNQNATLIAVSPGSVWETKRWTEQGFAGVCLALARIGHQILLLGSPGERQICENIKRQVAAMSSQAADSVQNLSGKTSVSEMVSILRKCKIAITNDNGAMHLASVAGIPVVSVFGPTVLAIGYRPWNDQAAVVQQEMSCRPCGKHGSDECPIGTHACMKEVSPEQVLKAVFALKPELKAECSPSR